MPVSKAQQKAVSKYMKENYDVYQIRMPKGKKDIIKAHAEARGESVNGFIGRAIDAALSGSTAQPGGLTPEALAEARKSAEAAGETVEAFVERAITTQAKRDKLTRGLARD